MKRIAVVIGAILLGGCGGVLLYLKHRYPELFGRPFFPGEEKKDDYYQF